LNEFALRQMFMKTTLCATEL